MDHASLSDRSNFLIAEFQVTSDGTRYFADKALTATIVDDNPDETFGVLFERGLVFPACCPVQSGQTITDSDANVLALPNLVVVDEGSTQTCTVALTTHRQLT